MNHKFLTAVILFTKWWFYSNSLHIITNFILINRFTISLFTQNLIKHIPIEMFIIQKRSLFPFSVNKIINNFYLNTNSFICTHFYNTTGFISLNYKYIQKYKILRSHNWTQSWEFCSFWNWRQFLQFLANQSWLTW